MVPNKIGFIFSALVKKLPECRMKLPDKYSYVLIISVRVCTQKAQEDMRHEDNIDGNFTLL